VECFQQFLIAVKITKEDQKRVMFLTSIGRNTYKTSRNLLFPKKAGGGDFQELGENARVISNRHLLKPWSIANFTPSAVDQASLYQLSLRSFGGYWSSAILETP